MSETTTKTGNSSTVADTVSGADIVVEDVTTTVTDDKGTADTADDTTSSSTAQRLKLSVDTPATVLTLGVAANSGGDTYGDDGFALYSDENFSTYVSGSAYFRTGSGDHTRRAKKILRDISDSASYENWSKSGSTIGTTGSVNIFAGVQVKYDGGIKDVVVKGATTSQTYDTAIPRDKDGKATESIKLKTDSVITTKAFDWFQTLSWVGHDIYTFWKNGVTPVYAALTGKTAAEAAKAAADFASTGLPSSPAGVVSNSKMITNIGYTRAFVHGLEAIGNLVFVGAGIAAFASGAPLFGTTDKSQFTEWASGSGQNVSIYGEDGVGIASSRSVTSFGIWGAHANSIYRASLKAVWSTAVKSWIDTTVFGGASVHVSSLGITKLTGKWIKAMSGLSMEIWSGGTASVRSNGPIVFGSNDSVFMQGINGVDINGSTTRVMATLALDLVSNLHAEMRGRTAAVVGNTVSVLAGSAPASALPAASPGMVASFVPVPTVNLTAGTSTVAMTPVSIAMAAGLATLTLVTAGGAVAMSGTVIDIKSATMINLT